MRSCLVARQSFARCRRRCGRRAYGSGENRGRMLPSEGCFFGRHSGMRNPIPCRQSLLPSLVTGFVSPAGVLQPAPQHQLTSLLPPARRLGSAPPHVSLGCVARRPTQTPSTESPGPACFRLETVRFFNKIPTSEANSSLLSRNGKNANSQLRNHLPGSPPVFSLYFTAPRGPAFDRARKGPVAALKPLTETAGSRAGTSSVLRIVT
jgi:hypothetical protein